MKKLFALLLVFVLCLGLASCGESGQTQTTEKTDTTTASSTPESTTAAAGDETTAEVTTAAATTAEVTTASPVAPEDAVAKNGDTYYSNLTDAFELASDGSTIVLLKDILVDMPIYPGCTGKITFDGQNHKITANVELTAFLIVEGFEVTVKNLKVDYTEATKSVGNGKTGSATISVGNEGKLFLDNCEFKAFWGDCLNVDAGGEITVFSGTYEIDVENNAQQSNVVCVNYYSKLTVKDGNFRRLGTVATNRALLRVNYSGPRIVIDGGNWECACGRLVFLNGASNTNINDATNDDIRMITINGGNFVFGTDTVVDGYNYKDGIFDMYKNGAVFVINGGNFEVKGSCPIPFFNCNSSNRIRVTINDGTFTNGTGSMFIAKTVAKETETEGVKEIIPGDEFIINGGTFINTEGQIFDSVSLKECFTVTGGTFNCTAAEKDAVKAIVGTAATVK